MPLITPALLVTFLLSLFHAGSYNTFLLLAMDGLLLGCLITSRKTITRGISVAKYNPTIALALSLFLLWFVLSLVWSQAVTATQASLLTILLIFLSALASSTLNDSQWQRLQIILVGTGIPLLLAAMMQLLLTDASRPDVVFINPNNLAGFLNLLALPALALYLRHSEPKHSVLTGVVVTLLVAAVIYTQSRGAAVAMLAGITLLLLISNSWRKRPISVAILWVAGGIALGAFLSSGELGHRFAATASKVVSEGGGGINARLPIWESSLEMARDQPTLGWGGGAFMQGFAAYRPPQFSQGIYNAHNDYLQIMVDLGPIGLTLFLFLMAVTLRVGITKSKDRGASASSAAALAAALATLATQMLFTSSLYTTPIALVSGIYLGRLAAIGTPATTSSRSAFTLGIQIVLLLVVFHICTLAISQFYIHRASNEPVPLKKFQLLESASRWDPLNDAPHYLTTKLVVDLLEQGQLKPDEVLEQALSRLDKAQSLMPLSRQHYLLRAKLLAYRHPVPMTEIKQLYETILTLNPKFLKARIEYAELLKRQGHHTGACQVLGEGSIEKYFARKTTLIEYLNLLIACGNSGLLSNQLFSVLPEQLTIIENNPHDMIKFRLPQPDHSLADK